MKTARASCKKEHLVTRSVKKADYAMNSNPLSRSSNWAKVSALLLFVSATLIGAQDYSMDWHKVAGGGGTSTGGGYSVSGTIGQHDASAPLTGGGFSLAGGFWALPAVQTPGSPALTIVVTSPNTAMVYWPSPSTGFNLQVNTDLAGTSWTAPAEAVQDNGTFKYIIVDPTTGSKFYRLKYP